MKAVVAAFNQEKALVRAFSVITNLRMQLFEALAGTGAGAGRCHNLRLILESYLSSALPTTRHPPTRPLSWQTPAEVRRHRSWGPRTAGYGTPHTPSTRHPITECLQQLFPRVDNDV